jgi:hypothetical protein
VFVQFGSAAVHRAISGWSAVVQISRQLVMSGRLPAELTFIVGPEIGTGR